jgi:autotransporter-associated beta strand protein
MTFLFIARLVLFLYALTIPRFVWAQICNPISTTIVGESAQISLMTGDCLFIDTNGSVISASSSGPLSNNGNAIDGVINSGIIDGSNKNYGIANLNNGSVVSITNNQSGSIAGNKAGILNDLNANINFLTNNGLINSSNYSIYNSGKIDNLINNSSGSITGNNYGIYSSSIATINSLTNHGLISSSSDYSIYNNGTIDNLINYSSGLISSSYAGVFNDSRAAIKSFNNSGVIDSFISILNLGKIDNLKNEGILRYSSPGKYIGIENDGSILSLVNGKMGLISAGYNGILNSSYIGTVLNSGSINLSSSTGGDAIDNEGKIDLFINDSSGSITAKGRGGLINNSLITVLKNDGLIDVSGSAGGKGIMTGRSGIIDTLTNTGSVNALGGAVGIYNFGKINTLNNLQGAGSLYGALSLSKNLPLAYNIIINSNLNYGQLALSQSSGTMKFGIYAGETLGVPASVVAVGVYSDVLQGLPSLSGISGTSGSYGGLNYSLVADSMRPGMWNLEFIKASANSLGIITGVGVNYQSLDLGVSLTPLMDGGTLKIASPGNIAYKFAISPNGGKIDQNALNSTFSGGFENLTGSNGKLVIVNSGQAGLGSVTLTGSSSHAGGIEVNAGAILNITSGSSLGTGPLDLVGSSTVPATLGILETTTITNPITVTGDPVFNIAQGTTTTVSSPISGSGDVVISGGGTLSLSAANTYTGPTSISNDGTTLALVGPGSIAYSSQLNNNGSFNVTGKTGDVSLGGTFTQGASGSLAMNFSPANNQRLNIVGVASLAGALSLNASSGTYRAGRYTLLTANNLTGTFGALSSNLSSYTNLGFKLTYDPNNVYLVLMPNLANTQNSLQNNAASLQGTYALQNSILANSFSYDCNVFAESNVCISAGGRNTAVTASNGLNNASALLITGYRINRQYRVGAYADQNMSVNNAGSGVILGNNTPLIGVFGAWNERTDDLGAEIKISAAYGQKNIAIKRAVVGTSEAGSGASQLNSQGAQVVAKYGLGGANAIVVSPYIGLRFTQNNMGGYTEASSSAVTAPLTYSALNTNATTALAGTIATYKEIPQTTLFASAGIESDTNTKNILLNASGLSGLTPVNFNSNSVKTRPTVSIGAYYDIDKNQRLGITGIYRQESYNATQTTSVLATYTVGL